MMDERDNRGGQDRRLEERRSDDRSEVVAGIHKRLDTIDAHVMGVRDAQHKAALNLMAVDKRIDLVEVHIEATKQREELLYKNLTDRLDNGSSVFKKLFDKFDQHTKDEENERRKSQEEQKKILWWVIGTAASVLSSIGMVLFTRVFA
jgi:2,3-bisphosphoglycerate-independent phosphoglycerate mutase